MQTETKTPFVDLNEQRIRAIVREEIAAERKASAMAGRIAMFAIKRRNAEPGTFEPWLANENARHPEWSVTSDDLDREDLRRSDAGPSSPASLATRELVGGARG